MQSARGHPKFSNAQRAVITIGVAVFAIVITVIVGVWNFKLTSHFKPPRPMYTDLEYWLLDECYGEGMEVMWDTGVSKEVLGSKYSYEFYDGFVTYTLTAWPDVSSGGSYVTQIRITDPYVTVYGLDVMSSKSEFKETMEELGYTVHTRENDRQVAMRDDYTIMITREGIPELYLSAAVTDRNGSF